MVRLLVPLIRVWRQLSGPDIPDDAEVARVRRMCCAFRSGPSSSPVSPGCPAAFSFPLRWTALRGD